MPPKIQPTSRSKTPPADGAWESQMAALLNQLQELLRERGGGEAGTSTKPLRTAPRPAAKAPDRASAETAAQIQIWEDDPFLVAVAGSDPVPAEPIDVESPENDQPLLQTQIKEQQPDPEIYQLGTAEFRYWNAAASLARGVNFWGPLLPAGTKWSAEEQPLQVALDNEEEDFNAFYARDSGLNFFHGTVDKVDPPVVVFSGESPHVVCHELGHAILDAVKPELFDAMSTEAGAFHEAFGDISSTLSALQLPSLREFVLHQTGGDLKVNSRLSQLARQLGWAIRVQVDPTAVDQDCLRNTSNNFFYQNPDGLPPSAPANQLSSEVHSFSRVFSGAFLDVLAGMFHIGPASSAADDSARLQAVARDAGILVIEGVRLASVAPAFFSQAAAGMIQADQTLNGGRYAAALTSSFVRHGILAPAAAVALLRDLRAHANQFGVLGRVASSTSLQFEGDNEGYKKTARDAPAMPLRPLSTRFGVTLYVHLPIEPQRFSVAAASLAGGTEKIISAEEDARSFVEDLIQLDRIAHEGAPGTIPPELIAPGKRRPAKKTHYLVREDGKVVLKRHHFDCCFCGCRRR
jgi:hypothetical protein